MFVVQTRNTYMPTLPCRSKRPSTSKTLYSEQAIRWSSEVCALDYNCCCTKLWHVLIWCPYYTRNSIAGTCSCIKDEKHIYFQHSSTVFVYHLRGPLTSKPLCINLNLVFNLNVCFLTLGVQSLVPNNGLRNLIVDISGLLTNQHGVTGRVRYVVMHTQQFLCRSNSPKNIPSICFQHSIKYDLYFV